MSNILIIYEVKDNTTDNNISSLTTVLSQMNTDSRVVKASDVSVNDINWCDVCLANRPNSPYSVNVVSAVKSAGGYVVVSLDDDIIHLPIKHPSYWRRRYTLQCMEIGDSLLSPNPLILDDYCEKYHLKPILTSAFVQENSIKAVHEIKGKVKIVYPAGKDHVGLFNKYLYPFFDQFIEEYKGKIDVTFVGVEPVVKKSEVVHFVKGMPYDDYLCFMKDNDFDIGIAPLEDNPFCARKYFPKYIEYSKYGIAGIYSNVAPYTFVLENMKNGVLVNDDPTEWKEALVKMIENPQVINDIATNAQKDLRKRFSLDNSVMMLRKGCHEFENYQRNGEIISFNTQLFPVLVYRIKDFYLRILYHLKHDGIMYFVNSMVKVN